MAAARKTFRIEETAAARPEPQVEGGAAALRHAEIMQELVALRAQLAAAQAPREPADRGETRARVAAMARIVRELDSVIKDSEAATQKILAAAEDIEQAASNLAAALRTKTDQGLALDIKDRVTAIFEASNFQDINGQRVSKVLSTLERLEISNGGCEKEAAGTTPGGATQLHGPPLDGDGNHVSQDEVDVIFGRGGASA